MTKKFVQKNFKKQNPHTKSSHFDRYFHTNNLMMRNMRNMQEKTFHKCFNILLSLFLILKSLFFTKVLNSIKQYITCLYILGNTVTEQGGHGHHQSSTHQENFGTASGDRISSPLPDNQVPNVPPARRDRDFNWKMTGVTECSASCGKGRKS